MILYAIEIGTFPVVFCLRFAVSERQLTGIRQQFLAVADVGPAKVPDSISFQNGGRIPRTAYVVGIITKEHIADSVAESTRPYAAADVLL